MKVVVLGAGVIGCAVAYYLSLRGIAATVVETRGVACAASGKSGGFLAKNWCDGQPQEQLARESFDLHADLAAHLGDDYGYHRLTTLAVATSARRSLRAFEGLTRPPWLDGDCAVRGVLGDGSTTAALHPARFTRALLEAARANGARLHLGTAEGIALDAARRRVAAVVVDGERVDADVVVVAMGPWCRRAVSWLPLPAMHAIKGHSVTLRTEPGAATEALFLEYEDERGGWHGPEVVPRSDGELYVSGFGDDAPLPQSPAGVHVDERTCRRLHSVASRLSSVLGAARIERRQACYRPVCADAVPIMGAVSGVAGAFVAGGHNCWGMLNAPGSGYAMAELIAEGESRRIDLTPFAPERLPLVNEFGS